MNILAFDTCFGVCTSAVGLNLGGHAPKVVSIAEPMTSGHAERLVPMIGEVLAAVGISLSNIDRIVVANGPGTFTGTRIAVSAARALTLASSRPMVAISSLEMIAHNKVIEQEPGRDLAVAMSANRGEVYYQLFSGQCRTAKTKPMLLTVETAAEFGGRGLVTAVGSGAKALEAAAQVSGFDVLGRYPEVYASAGDVLSLALRMSPLAEQLRPLYLRPPDAKPQDGKSLARAP